jgi:4-methyl-5(b-hydroxyethyl)-thiazole monophosphate biosynthesis
MSKRALVLWADGFEEIEAVAPVDVLRRAGVTVTTAGLNGGAVTGAHGIAMVPDVALAEVATEAFDAVVLPGGLPGAENLAASEEVTALLYRAVDKGWWIGAICASPALVLSPLGLLHGRRATCYPGFESRLDAIHDASAKVVRDGKFITATGPGTAIAFGLALAEALVGEAKAGQVAGGLLVR